MADSFVVMKGNKFYNHQENDYTDFDIGCILPSVEIAEMLIDEVGLHDGSIEQVRLTYVVDGYVYEADIFVYHDLNEWHTLVKR